MKHTLFKSSFKSPLGLIILESVGEKLSKLYFAKNENSIIKNANDLDIFKQTKLWLELYFKAKKPDFIPPLSLNDTAFRLEVWQHLQKIEYGSSISYGQIAKHLAQKRGIVKMSSRAVGAAVGHNPISLIIPCHRVLGFNNKLTGFNAGLERKKALLELENIPYTE